MMRVYLKDGTSFTMATPASVKPWPNDSNFIAGVDPNGVMTALIPVEHCVGAEIE